MQGVCWLVEELLASQEGLRWHSTGVLLIGYAVMLERRRAAFRLVLWQFMNFPPEDLLSVCSNYRGISLLSTTYKILSNILLSRLTPFAEEIVGDHQCGFRRNRSTTDHIFCIRQILEKK
jgi:hypothetical protein